MTIRIDRARLGRRIGRRCLTATRSRRHRPGCTRLIAAGSLTRKLAAGRRSVPFSGRIPGKALKPGTYTAIFTAKAKTGKATSAKAFSFRIVRP